jgi:capsular exopolysaccharide synthesis family protein
MGDGPLYVPAVFLLDRINSMSRIVKALKKSKEDRDTLFDRGGQDNRPGQRQSGSNDDTLERFRLNKASMNAAIQRKRRIVLGATGESAKSAYNVLRTRVLQRLHTNAWTKLAISSAGINDGKTLTAINLAISMARQGHQRVVLIDFDLQRPTVKTYLGLESIEHYLSDYISGDVGPSDIMHSTSIEHLWVIPNNRSFQNSSEILASDSIAELVNWIGKVDPNCVMLFDLPPMLVSDDVLAVSPLFDTLLVVLAEGETSRQSARNTRELIEDHNIELLGTVLNKSSDRMAKYKY